MTHDSLCPWFLLGLCTSLLSMNGAPQPQPEPLHVLQMLLDQLREPDLFVSLTGQVLALQALDEAPALLTPPAEPSGAWSLKVYFLLDEFDRPRLAAPRFMAEHGGRVLLQGERLTVASAVFVTDPATVLGLYRAACRMKGHLRQVRATSPL